MVLVSVLLCGYSSWCSGQPRKRITQGIIEICFHILNLPLANLNPIIFLVKQYQYMQLNLDFCNSVRRSVHVCMFVHMCEFTYMFVCIHMEAWGLNWVSSFSTLCTEAVCWPGFFFFLVVGKGSTWHNLESSGKRKCQSRKCPCQIGL